MKRLSWKRVVVAIDVCCRFEGSDLLPDTRYCGQPYQKRIHGGSSTHFNDYPWTALIRFKKSKFKSHQSFQY